MGFVEAHFFADLILGLFEEVEAGEDFAVAAGAVSQDIFHDLSILGADGDFFGADVAVGDFDGAIDVELIAAAHVVFFDETGDLAADDGADEAHEAFGVAEVAALDGLDDDDEGVVDAIIDILSAQLTNDQEFDTAREEVIEFFEGLLVIDLDATDEVGPIDLLRGVGGRCEGDRAGICDAQQLF